MKALKLLAFFVIMIFGGAVSSSAQMGVGMMGGNMPPDIAKMMQEQNKALAQASIQYMTVFAKSLQTQSKERRDQIDDDFIKSAFGEMKRAFEMIDKFQNAHVKTMDANVQAKVQPMMGRMNRNLTALKKNLDDLRRELTAAVTLRR